jgi:hypothetical protein
VVIAAKVRERMMILKLTFGRGRRYAVKETGYSEHGQSEKIKRLERM